MTDRLGGLDDLDGAEAWKWTVYEEHLDRDVGLDMSLGHERHNLASGQLFDRVLVTTGHHTLEFLPHRDDASWLSAVHQGLFQSGEPAAAHDHDDDVVQRVGLGLHRP